MANEAGIAIGDDQVPFALLQRQARRAESRLCPGRIQQSRRKQPGPVIKSRFAVGQMRDCMAHKKFGAQSLGASSKMECNRWRIDNCVLNHEQSASQPRPQIRFHRGQLMPGKQPARHFAFTEVALLAFSLGQLLIVGRHPDGSNSFVLGAGRQICCEPFPQSAENAE